jgi:hypothetical protein
MTEIQSILQEEFTSFFLKQIISFGKNKRQEYFLSEFLKAYPKELKSGVETNALDKLFRKIEASEEMKEMIFEVYRKVCLSASKSLGPKIMGILTSQICFEERIANSTEELIFETCEILNDRELREIVKLKESIRWLSSGNHGKIPYDNSFYTLNDQKHVHKCEIMVFKGKRNYDIELANISTKNKSSYQEEVSKPSLEKYFGRWAIKLRNIEILKENTTENFNYGESKDSESETIRKFSITLNKEFFDSIVLLINRATGPNT